MFGLDVVDTVTIAGFALTTLGMLLRLSVQAGRVLARLEDHEHRIRRLEGRPHLTKAVTR